MHRYVVQKEISTARIEQFRDALLLRKHLTAARMEPQGE